MGYLIACFSQNCSGLLKLSRWHLQTLRPIVSSPDRCGFNTSSSLFSRKRLSISTVFGADFLLRQDCALQLSILTNVYVSIIDVKNVFYVFYSGHVFLRFLTFFYFFSTFLFSSNVVKEARRGRIFKFHGLTKAYAQLQHLLAIRRSEGHDD